MGGSCFRCSCVKNAETPQDELEGILFGLGNPLLDILAYVEDTFLLKYKLGPSDSILAEDEHLPMYDDLVKSYKVQYIAGGATQNSLRVAQWVVGKPNVCTYIGAVGEDNFAETLKTIAHKDGINACYVKWPQCTTGTCAVLITGKDRCLCANLGASKYFTKEILDKPDIMSLMKKAKYFYIEGYFLAVSPSCIMTVGQHAAETNKTFAMNLSAEYIPINFTDSLLEVLQYVDILFGNEMEARKFAEVQNYNTNDLIEIGKRLANLPKYNSSRQRIVVLTRGDSPVILVQGALAKQFPVKQLTKDVIKDTNGAGDSFVGGFLAQLLQGKCVEECIKCGIWAATEVIQCSGCTFPKDKLYDPSSEK